VTIAGAQTITGQKTFSAAVLVADGTVALPGVAFSADTDSGLYRIGANNIGVGVNGAKVLDIGTAGLGITGTSSATGVFLGPAGTAGAPTYSFTADPNTGIINSSADALGFVTAGVEKWVINSSGALNPVLSNTYDIGGIFHPRSCPRLH